MNFNEEVPLNCISDFEKLIVEKNRIEHFSCRHVLLKDYLQTTTIGTSSNEIKFVLISSFNSRDNTLIVKRNYFF